VALQKTLGHVGNLRLKFDKRSQLFIGVHNETLSVAAMRINEFLKEHRKNEEQQAIIERQQKQTEALTAGLQKVSAQLELSKPAPQTSPVVLTVSASRPVAVLFSLVVLLARLRSALPTLLEIEPVYATLGAAFFPTCKTTKTM
jgi:predicted phage tail protein